MMKLYQVGNNLDNMSKKFFKLLPYIKTFMKEKKLEVKIMQKIFITIY